MKNIIYYFTGTGNSLKVARDIAASLDDCSLIPINNKMIETFKNESPEKLERVGICFPVYAWGPPLIIKRFIKKLQPSSSCYYFGVTTCASSPGGSMPYIRSLLKKQGITLSSGFVVPMPTNYIAWGGADSEEKQKDYFEKEQKRIDVILPQIKEKKTAPLEKSRLIIRPLTALLYRISIPFFPKMDKKFITDEKCNGCAICEKVCPVENIKMAEKKPTWLHKCEQCYACLQWCPQESIQIGKKTLDRTRYHHPEISLKDMISEKGR